MGDEPVRDGIRHHWQMPADKNEFFAARREHAFWLRTNEQLTYRKIGQRLGICLERARQLVCITARIQDISDDLRIGAVDG